MRLTLCRIPYLQIPSASFRTRSSKPNVRCPLGLCDSGPFIRRVSSDRSGWLHLLSPHIAPRLFPGYGGVKISLSDSCESVSANLQFEHHSSSYLPAVVYGPLLLYATLESQSCSVIY